jgi:polyisoprenoid-binding protein YceI
MLCTQQSAERRSMEGHDMSSINDLTPGTWIVDPTHSTVGFTARHLMVTKVRGRFASFSGSATIAEDRLQSSVEASVDMASVSTGDEGRDGHLRAGDFFDAEAHPTMTFVSTGITADGSDHALTGDLTIKGVTKPVTFALEFDGVATDPWNNTKAGFTAETEINRKDWGLEWNVALEAGGVLVSEKIKIQLDIQLLKHA